MKSKRIFNLDDFETNKVKDLIAELRGYTKIDPEAWREENRKKQAAGVRFKKISAFDENVWVNGNWYFDGNKEDYREVPLEQPAIGVISSFNKWDRVLTENEISDLFSGKVRPEDIPQEEPKIKEIGVGIPEASREVLKQWQANGLKFSARGVAVKFTAEFTDIGKNIYTISEQTIPEGMSWATIKGMFKQGLRLDVDANFNGVWRKLTEDPKWSSFSKERLRIPFQPIPEKLLEVPQPAISPESPEMRDHRISEAIANLARNYCADKGTAPLPKAIPHVVVSNIEEVKPKTVKYYFALCVRKSRTFSISDLTAEGIQRRAKNGVFTIIGDIESREVEV